MHSHLSSLLFASSPKGVRAQSNVGHQTGITIWTLIQRNSKAFSAHGSLVRLPPLSEVIAPCIIFDQEALQFSVLLLGVNGFASNKQRKSLQDTSGPLTGPDEVEPEAYARTSGRYTFIRYITYALFRMLYNFIRNNVLYELRTN